MPKPRPKAESVVVGIVGRPHGVRGEVSIDIRTDEPTARFVVGRSLALDKGGQIKIKAIRWDRGRLLVKFEDCPTRDEAEALRGRLLSAEVDPNERPKDPEEYFDRQLVGLQVRNHLGETVGEVAAVLHHTAQELLEVAMTDQTRLVPFVKALVPVISLDDGYLQLADVPGLLEDVE